MGLFASLYRLCLCLIFAWFLPRCLEFINLSVSAPSMLRFISFDMLDPLSRFCSVINLTSHLALVHGGLLYFGVVNHYCRNWVSLPEKSCWSSTSMTLQPSWVSSRNPWHSQRLSSAPSSKRAFYYHAWDNPVWIIDLEALTCLECQEMLSLEQHSSWSCARVEYPLFERLMMQTGQLTTLIAQSWGDENYQSPLRVLPFAPFATRLLIFVRHNHWNSSYFECLGCY